MDNTIKEVKEEAGLDVSAEKVIAILDKAKNNPARSAHRVTKIFILCKSLGGAFVPNAETVASDYFSLDELPVLSEGKTTAQQIALCFEAEADEHWQTRFD